MFGNKKGSENQGAKTGRGLGTCSGSENPGFESNEAPMGMRRGNGFGSGMGYGPGMGMGRGFGRGFGASGGYGRAMKKGSGSGADNMVSDNTEIKARLDSIETLLKEIKK
jgi:hypothetical protein